MASRPTPEVSQFGSRSETPRSVDHHFGSRSPVTLLGGVRLRPSNELFRGLTTPLAAGKRLHLPGTIPALTIGMNTIDLDTLSGARALANETLLMQSIRGQSRPLLRVRIRAHDLDESGIAVLVRAHSQSKIRGGRLEIVEAPEGVKAKLRSLGLAGIFGVNTFAERKVRWPVLRAA